VAHEIADNGWCALTAEPVVDQADQVNRAQTRRNNAPTWGWGNVRTTAANWGSADGDEHDSWAPTPPPTLTSISNNVGYTRDAISGLSIELGSVRSELRSAWVRVLLCVVMFSLLIFVNSTTSLVRCMT